MLLSAPVARAAEACTQTFVCQASSWCAARPKKAVLRDAFVRLPPAAPKDIMGK